MSNSENENGNGSVENDDVRSKSDDVSESDNGSAQESDLNHKEDLNADLVKSRIKHKVYQRVKVTGRTSAAYALIYKVFHGENELEDWYSCISCGHAFHHKVSKGTGPLLRHYNSHVEQSGSGSSKESTKKPSKNRSNSSKKKITVQNVKDAASKLLPKEIPSSKKTCVITKRGKGGNPMKNKSSPFYRFLKSQLVELLFRASRLGPVAKDRIATELPGPTFW